MDAIFFIGCSDEAIDQDAVVNDPTYRRFVSYHGGDTGTYMIYQGYKYDVQIDGDYVILRRYKMINYKIYYQEYFTKYLARILSTARINSYRNTWWHHRMYFLRRTVST